MSDHDSLPIENARPARVGPDVSRRRLLKGGAATAPVLLAITTRPARAAIECKSASAFGSMTASGQRDNGFSCTGRSPGYWKQSQWFSAWPAPYYPTTVAGVHVATQFHAVFGGSAYTGKTLLQVLDPSVGDELGRHIVAALLNAAAGLTPVLDVAGVLDIWHEYVAKGYFEPTAGVHWDAADIVDYLKSTMI